MNKHMLWSLGLMCLNFTAFAANATDQTLTGTDPFANGVTVNLENEGSALIIQDIKPSLVLSQGLLNNITIDGEKAADGTNCQVRMYAHGTIVLPYDKNFKPLTVYSEQNCEGESCSDFGLEHNGGYMNTLSKSKLNNRIRSFVLKRGYMVTFAVGQGGWGYSRCFIAQDEDLVLNELPAILDQRISSYRVFKWVYAQKKGLASDANAERNAMLGTCWTYDWAQGNTSLEPDVEWVPNHIYEDWPSSSSIGSRSGTCHTKCNNEPANNSDDHPQSVETVLDNWQNMMRTGLRLCSPATHDGGWGWHNQFMDEIDKRGWRCDVVDFHGYWNSGTWGSLDWMIDTYAHGRPVWFSEWIWGSSWGKQGIFAEGAAPDGVGSFSERNQQACYAGTKPILDKLNANSRVERYAYWNGENVASRIIHDGQLSVLGRYYAEMKTPMAYRQAYEFVPKAPTLTATDNLEATFNRKAGIVALKWTESFGDLITSITLQRKDPDSSTWTDVASYDTKDQSSAAGVSYSAYDTLATAQAGKYEYRIMDIGYNNRALASNTVSISITSQQSAADFIFGSSEVPYALDMTSSTTINSTVAYADLEGLTEVPVAILGLPTYYNRKCGVTTFLNSIGKSLLKFGIMTWLDGYTGSYTASESIDYMVIPEGTYMYGDMQVVSGKQASVGNTEVEVVFPTPFPEGETPVVVCQPYMTNLKYGTVARVSDVTNRGFKVRHVAQSTQSSVSKKSIYYIAASKGQASLGDGSIISAGTSSSPVGGRTASVAIAFETESGDTLSLANPTIICGPQTDRLPELATSFRITSIVKDGDAVKGMNIIRQFDASSSYKGTNTAAANGDTMGWICISTAAEGDDTPVRGIVSSGAASTRVVYSLDGKRFTQPRLSPGIYIIKEGTTTRKVIIR